MRNKRKLFKSQKAVIAIIVVIAVIVGAVFGVRWFTNKRKAAMSTGVVGVDVVKHGDIEVSITGEAAVEPYERFEIIPLVSGDIISSPYDVGDAVEEGAVLYQFDTESAQSSIERQEISLAQSRNNLANAKSDLEDARENLVLKADNNGIISGLDIKKGSSVSNGQMIATITNTKDLEVTVPFTAGQVSAMFIGQPATVSSSLHMSTAQGEVASISSEPEAQNDGSILYNVRIDFENPGSFMEGLTVGASVSGMYSPGYGIIKIKESGNLKAEIAGTVEEIYHSNGDYVNKGDTIAILSSDSLKSQERSITNSELNLRNAELSMKDTRDSLDDYSLTAPISGTVITKNAKAGDTIDRTNSSTTLMVIADVSRLKFSLEIDELDVRKVKEGQKVSITCDALPNERFEGTITSISVEGTATNGVTTYTAEIVIDNPGNLRPSMNVDASVIIDSASDVLMVPTADIKTAMGVSYVFLKDETGTRGATEEDFMNAMNGRMQQRPFGNDGVEGGFDAQTKPSDEKPDINGYLQESESNTANNTRKNNRGSMGLPEAPEGFVIAIVETGISDDEYTEILSGLSEGDEIQQLSVTSTSNNMFGMMGGMPGGGMMGGNGGRMSSGGGGTMPGGGMR